MRKSHITALLFLMLQITIQAQSNDYNNLYNTFTKEYDASAMSLSKSAFSLLETFIATTDADTKENATNLAESLDELKILVCTTYNGKTSFDQSVRNLLPESSYDEIDVSNYQEAKTRGLRVLVLRKLATIKEAHIICPNAQGGGSLVSFFGDFKLKDIKRLMQRSGNWQNK